MLGCCMFALIQRSVAAKGQVACSWTSPPIALLSFLQTLNVLSFCFCGLLRKEDAKEVGIWNVALPVLFCMAREDGVLIFVARAGSNDDLCLVRMDICLLYLAASEASARFRNSETLTSAMPRRDFVSRRMGAV